MSFKLEVDPQDKIASITVEGALDNTIRMQVLNAVAHESKVGNCSGALIDLTNSTFDLSEPIDGAVKLTMYMSDLEMSPETKLALVYEGAEFHRATYEKITQKIGYQLRYFKDTEDAYLWLKSPSMERPEEPSLVDAHAGK